MRYVTPFINITYYLHTRIFRFAVRQRLIRLFYAPPGKYADEGAKLPYWANKRLLYLSESLLYLLQ